MQYDLYFRHIKVGVVTQDGMDFPNLWGIIAYDESVIQPTSEEQKRLASFLYLACDSIQLADEVEQEQSISVELEGFYKQLESFYDYIKTDDWVLIGNSNETHGISCPIFRHTGEIVWRWNVK